MYKVARERFEVLSQILVDAQAWFLSTLFYFTVMVPFGLGMRLFGDPLAIKGQTTWIQREPVGSSLDDARRQG